MRDGFDEESFGAWVLEMLVTAAGFILAAGVVAAVVACAGWMYR